MLTTLARLDVESQAWIDRLSPHRNAAIAALHALLLKAARRGFRARLR